MRPQDLGIDPGRYIAVYGPSGSGKSTLARSIGERLGLPVVELDSVIHGPNWQDLDRETFRARVRELLERHPDGWVFEGNYHAMIGDLVLARASTAVWVRLPFHVVYPRLVRRTLGRCLTGEELWNGNRETFRLAFFSKESILLWGITNWRAHHRRTRQALRTVNPSTRIVVLRSRCEVRGWLAALTASGAPSPAASPT